MRGIFILEPHSFNHTLICRFVRKFGWNALPRGSSSCDRRKLECSRTLPQVFNWAFLPTEPLVFPAWIIVVAIVLTLSFFFPRKATIVSIRCVVVWEIPYVKIISGSLYTTIEDPRIMLLHTLHHHPYMHINIQLLGRLFVSKIWYFMFRFAAQMFINRFLTS